MATAFKEEAQSFPPKALGMYKVLINSWKVKTFKKLLDNFQIKFLNVPGRHGSLPKCTPKLFTCGDICDSLTAKF